MTALTRYLLIFILIAGAGSLLFRFSACSPAQRMPEPTEHNPRQKEGRGQGKLRRAFIENMHRAAPGDNWRLMDESVRMERGRERAFLLRQPGSRSQEWDTIGGGVLIGKWKEVGSFNTAGRMWAAEMDYATNTLYTFSQGGNLWRSDPQGANWRVLNDHFNQQSALFLRKLEDRLLVGVDGWGRQGFFWTTDEGITWHNTSGLENVVSWGNIRDVHMLNNESRTLFLLTLEWDYQNWNAITCLYRSDNLGASFEKVRCFAETEYGGSDRFSIWSNRYGSPVLYLSENQHIYAIDSAGAFTEAGSLPTDHIRNPIMTGRETGDTVQLYMSYRDQNDQTRIAASQDGGASWEIRGSVEEGPFSGKSFHALHTVDGHLFFGGVNAFRSKDGGATWEKINEWWEYYGNELYKLHADIPIISSFPDPETGIEKLIISTDGGLFVSENQGFSFTNITMTGMRNAQYYDIHTYNDNPDIIYAGSQDQGYQRTSAVLGEEYHFDQVISGDYGHLSSQNGGRDLWMVYPGFAMFNPAAHVGNNLFFWDFVGQGHLWMAPLVEDPYDPRKALWGGGSTQGGGSYLYALSFNGAGIVHNQLPYNFDPNGTGVISAMGHSPVDPTVRYVLTTDGRFFFSLNDGQNWTQSAGFTGPGNHYFYGSSIAASRKDPHTVYIAGSGYSNSPVFVSYDHGQTFSPLNKGLPGTLVYSICTAPDDKYLFAATEIGPYVFDQASGEWFDLAGSNAPYQVYWNVHYVDDLDRVRFGTYGRGIWELEIATPEVNSTAEADPGDKALRIWPNPAADQVQIDLPFLMHRAEISVWGLDGRQALPTIHTAFNPGFAQRIDLQDLSAGVYLVQVRNRDTGRKWSAKMVRAK